MRKTTPPRVVFLATPAVAEQLAAGTLPKPGAVAAAGCAFCERPGARLLMVGRDGRAICERCATMAREACA